MTFEPYLPIFIEQGTAWLHSLRATHRSTGEPLERSIQSLLVAYFEPDLLNQVRLSPVGVLPNPPFYHLLPSGMPRPHDFSAMDAMTAVDTILICQRYHPVVPITLLFHELVHVVQFSVLGVDEFVRCYVTGWAANGYEYRRIPLEAQAYELQAKYQAGRAPFRIREAIVQAE